MSSKISFLALIVAVAALGLTVLQSPAIQPTTLAKETVYERVMRTKTLRCAYFMWRPVLFKDPTTGQMQGIMPELLDQMAKDLGIKIDYVEEVNFLQVFEGFKTGRYDAVCGPLTPTTARAGNADFIAPFGFSFVNAYARVDDKRFDEGVARINQKDVRIATIDGELSSQVSPLRFPDAQTIMLPNIGDGASLIMQITTNKADVVITDPFSAAIFMASNPEQIREVAGGPVAIFPGTMAIPVNEYPLKAMLDNATDYLVSTGYITNLVKKYGMTEGLFIPKPSYETVK